MDTLDGKIYKFFKIVHGNDVYYSLSRIQCERVMETIEDFYADNPKLKGSNYYNYYTTYCFKDDDKYIDISNIKNFMLSDEVQKWIEHGEQLTSREAILQYFHVADTAHVVTRWCCFPFK